MYVCVFCVSFTQLYVHDTWHNQPLHWMLVYFHTYMWSRTNAFFLSSSQLIPQFLFLTLGITGATLYLIRLARGPHVT